MVRAPAGAASSRLERLDNGAMIRAVERPENIDELNDEHVRAYEDK